MLSKKFRLNRKQIGFIHKKGRRLNMVDISIKCLANHLEYCRFAVNVPVKVSKKATERNRIRRIVYDEIGQLTLAKCKLKGSDCLVNIYSKDDDEKLLREKIKKICLSI